MIIFFTELIFFLTYYCIIRASIQNFLLLVDSHFWLIKLQWRYSKVSMNGLVHLCCELAQRNRGTCLLGEHQLYNISMCMTIALPWNNNKNIKQYKSAIWSMFFCGLHVMDNLGMHAEKPIYECENIIEKQGSMHVDFKITQVLERFLWGFKALK